jgi:replicative DNA helicase
MQQNKKNSERLIATKIDAKQPSALDIEEQILGAIILEPQSSFMLLPALPKPSDFYNKTYQEIMQIILDMKEKNMVIDISTVSHYAKKMLNKNIAYEIVHITTKVNSSQNIASHYFILKEYALKRKMIESCIKTAQSAYQDDTDALEILNVIQKDLQDITSDTFESSQKRVFDGVELYEQTLAKIKENIQKRWLGEAAGISTGLKQLDEILGGWKKGKLYFIAARPSMGKTATALNFAYNAIKQNKKVLYFSLEMTKYDIFLRLLVLEANFLIDEYNKKGYYVEMLSNLEAENGNVTEEQLFFLEKAGETLNLENLFITDASKVTNQEFNSICYSQKMKTGLDLVISDYIQLKKGDKAERKDLELGSISANSKQIAKTLDIPVIELAQLNRDVEKRENKIPQMSDLKNTGNFEEDADVVIMLYRPTYYGIETFEDGTSAHEKIGFYIRKNRSGAVTPDAIIAKYILPTNQIKDLT